MKELKRLPYTVSTVMLGSRERLCINNGIREKAYIRKNEDEDSQDDNQNVPSNPKLNINKLNMRCRNSKCNYRDKHKNLKITHENEHEIKEPLMAQACMDIEDLNKVGKSESIELCPFYLAKRDN